MKKQLAGLFSFLVLLSPLAMAQPQLPSPGITPDSPFYFLDKAFDAFQSSEAVANERVAEIKAMAERNKTQAMEKAVEGYQNALQRRIQQGNQSAAVAEEVARQTSNHLSILAQVRQRVPEQAKDAIGRAINNSARGRERAIKAINRTNPERARIVAQNTLQEVMSNTPEQAQAGLQRALKAVTEKGPGKVTGKGKGNGTQGPDVAPDTPVQKNLETGSTPDNVSGDKGTGSDNQTDVQQVQPQQPQP
ncbi:MAG: DUF5667 domain-containing protein [Candidatus Aenigmatarchaeota archaeon]